MSPTTAHVLTYENLSELILQKNSLKIVLTIAVSVFLFNWSSVCYQKSIWSAENSENVDE